MDRIRPAHAVPWRCVSQMAVAWCALAVLLVMLFALAGCGGSSSTVTVSPTSLVIVRTVPSVIQGDVQPLNITITDDTAVRAFYQRTLALPPMPGTNGAVTGCSDAHGIRYLLIFSQGETVVLFGRLTQGSCGGLQLLSSESQVSRQERRADTAYLDTLASLLGISPTQVWPIPGASRTPTATS